MRWGPRQVAVAGLALLAPVAVLAAWWRYGATMPDPLPTHWDMSGSVDGTTDRGAFLGACLAATTLVSAATIAAIARPFAGQLNREFVVATAWVSWLLAAVFVDVAVVSSGAAGAASVQQTWGQVAATLVTPFVVALVAWVLLPPAVRSRPAPPLPASTLNLAADERVTWVGQARSPRLVAAAVVLMLVAMVLVLASWLVALALLLTATALAWSHVVTVRVGSAGVSVAWGPMLWPRTDVRLREIAAARVEDINPIDWGGWGYRVTPRGRAHVVRKGTGLVLERHGRPAFAVTVDHPEQACELVNALLARTMRGGEHPGTGE